MKKLRITVGDKTYDVTVEVLGDETLQHVPSPPPAGPNKPIVAPAKEAAPAPTVSLEAGAITSPLAGVIISVLVVEGEAVEAGQELIILEAMKMENFITAPVAGTVKSIHASEGESVPESHLLLVLE